MENQKVVKCPMNNSQILSCKTHEETINDFIWLATTLKILESILEKGIERNFNICTCFCGHSMHVHQPTLDMSVSNLTRGIFDKCANSSRLHPLLKAPQISERPQRKPNHNRMANCFQILFSTLELLAQYPNRHYISNHVNSFQARTVKKIAMVQFVLRCLHLRYKVKPTTL